MHRQASDERKLISPMRIEENEIVIWTAPLRASNDVISRYAQTLSADELRRAAAFRFPHLRESYLVAHGVARRILSNLTGTDPGDVRIVLGKNGKPELVNLEGLHFNMAHSGELMALAVTRVGPVGVDVEQLRRLSDMKSLSEHFFSREERNQLECPQDVMAERFFRCWTLKEAFLKSTGEGLSRALDSFAVAFTSGAEAALLRISEPSDDPRAWTLRSFDPAPGYTGACAIRATGVRLTHCNFDHQHGF